MSSVEYIVRINFQKSKNHITGMEEVECLEKAFTDYLPIYARTSALSFFDSYLDSLLQSMGKPNVNFKETKDLLKPLYMPSSRTNGFPDYLGKVMGVFVKYNLPYDKEEPGYEQMIHGMGGNDDPLSILLSLQNEYEFYEHYQVDKGELATSVNYYDAEDDDTQNYPILKTNFNWEGYDIPPDNLSESYTREEIIWNMIKNGEDLTVEFKSSLLYHFSHNRFHFSVMEENAKAICAFANSPQGGVLLLGVRDDGTIQGLDFDFSQSIKENVYDYFRLQFDHLLRRHFEHRMRNSLEYGFVQIDGKKIYAVRVSPSTVPVFIKSYIRNEETGHFDDFTRVFYYRSAASSIQIKDNKELVDYCLDRFRN